MRRSIEIDPEESAHHRFAYELRRRRLELGWTQAQLGRRVSATGSYIGMIESMRRRPPLSFVEACDKALSLQGALRDLHLVAWPPPPPGPTRFRDWTTIEQQAGAIQSWDPLLIPGVFQTEPYARRLFEGESGLSQAERETRIATRMQRKCLLDREDPPAILSLIDEGVLYRPMGSPEVMHQQLGYLLEVAHHPQVTIQMVPYDAHSAVGLDASFTIFEPRRGGTNTVFVDSVPFVRVLGEPSMVKAAMRRYDEIRAIACSRHQTLKIVEEAMGKWT